MYAKKYAGFLEADDSHKCGSISTDAIPAFYWVLNDLLLLEKLQAGGI
jgi:hypothetical protein